MQRPFVAKVGGSLFDLPDLRYRLQSWLAGVRERSVLLVPGGGAGADAIRQLDKIHHLGESHAHELAIAIMAVNARFLSLLLCRPVVTNGSQLGAAVLDVGPFLLNYDSGPNRLAQSWKVTSDSIAARIASILGADLVLLKSVDLPPCCGWPRAAQEGFVDSEFPTTALGLNVQWLNLRAWDATPNELGR